MRMELHTGLSTAALGIVICRSFGRSSLNLHACLFPHIPTCHLHQQKALFTRVPPYHDYFYFNPCTHLQSLTLTGMYRIRAKQYSISSFDGQFSCGGVLWTGSYGPAHFFPPYAQPITQPPGTQPVRSQQGRPTLLLRRPYGAPLPTVGLLLPRLAPGRSMDSRRY